MPRKPSFFQNIIRLLYFTRAERRGLALIFAIGALIWCGPIGLRLLNRSQPKVDISSWKIALQSFEKPAASPIELFPFNPNTAEAADFVRLGLSERLAASIIRFREKGGVFRKSEDFKKIYNLTPEDFERLLPYIQLEEPGKPNAKNHLRNFVPENPSGPFNPNLIKEEQWIRWGVPPHIARRIIHFGEKGGVFRKKLDLAKIYDFPEAVYKRLEPFIEFPEKPVAFSKQTEKKPKPETLPIDINTASETDWQSLPGIGAGRAGYIVRYREKLGGFFSPDQIREVRGLPDSVFQKIKPFLQCKSGPEKKINLNSAPVSELSAHPYISQKQASLLTAFRQQHGKINDMAALSRISDLFRESSWQEKIKHYLSF